MENQTQENKYLIPISVVIAGILISGTWVYSMGNNSYKNSNAESKSIATAQDNSVSITEEAVIPSNGVTLPVSWGDLGAQLVSVGAIDEIRFKALYDKRGQFTDEYENLLLENNGGKLTITKDNSGYLLNMFWALGLASNNPILDSGEMSDKAYGGTQNFASTGGWTMAKGNSMDHYSRHAFFNLTSKQQALVDKVSRGIYRPCCNNSTHFPDCNHGMAMLGLLELMASQDASEQDMWSAALAVNSYWFPDTYITIASYMKNKGIEWKDVNPQEILGVNYSSKSGYAKILSQVAEPSSSQGGSGCAVDAGQSVPTPSRQQSGCGI